MDTTSPPLCAECGVPSPLPLLLPYAKRRESRARPCHPCWVTAFKRANPQCMCADMRASGLIFLLPCVHCRRTDRDVCSCKTQPLLLRMRCNRCDPSHARRRFDRCQCDAMPPLVLEYETGWTDRWFCFGCWADFVRMRGNWVYRLIHAFGTHIDACEGPFRLSLFAPSSSPESAVAAIVDAASAVDGLLVYRSGKGALCRVVPPAIRKP